MKYHLLSFANDFWHKHLRRPAGYCAYAMAAGLYRAKAYPLAFSLCLRSCRYYGATSSYSLLTQLFNTLGVPESQVSTGINLDEASSRTIILKFPEFLNNEVISKGVMIIAFTKTFSFFKRNLQLDALQHYFNVILEPSWSGYADPDILSLFNKNQKLIIQSPEIEDRLLLNNFLEYCVPTTFGAGNWVDSTLFRPYPSEKLYDSVYIANTSPIKRVKRYLQAVKKISQKDPSYKGCLVCASWGGAENLMADFVKKYQLENNLTLKFSLSRDEVIKTLNASKVNILLSFKEGSNRSLFEAMFCNIPAILVSENIGVNKAYINEHTGLLLADTHLEYGLSWMKQHFHHYQPRHWALENLSPEATTAQLIRLLNTHLGENYSQLLVKTNNPEMAYQHYPQLQQKKFSHLVLSLFLTDTPHPHHNTQQKLLAIEQLFQKEADSTLKCNFFRLLKVKEILPF